MKMTLGQVLLVLISNFLELMREGFMMCIHFFYLYMSYWCKFHSSVCHCVMCFLICFVFFL